MNEKNLINEVLAAFGWKVKDLAARLGYDSPQSVYNMRNDPTKITKPIKAHLETLLELAALKKKQERNDE